MKTDKYTKDKRYLRAKKKVEALKGFYWHLAIYVIISSFSTFNRVLSNMDEFNDSYLDAFLSLEMFFVWTPWGLGVLIHGLVVFDVFSFILGKGWEERKINELMNKDVEKTQEL